MSASCAECPVDWQRGRYFGNTIAEQAGLWYAPSGMGVIRSRLNSPTVIGLLLLVAIGGVALWLRCGPVEPVYEGKSLSQWLENHTASSAANPPYGSPGWHKANDALRAIGSNSVPTLLKMISAKNPPPSLRRKSPIR